MSKKRSLGSTPIGLETAQSSLQFIPDLGDTNTRKSSSGLKAARDPVQKKKTGFFSPDRQGKQQNSLEKKVVSYYLEKELITRIKAIADEQEMYYSALVSQVLSHWIAQNR